MQSTGHSSMHALSSRSTQGSVMMYVTSELLFHRPPAGPVGIADYQPKTTVEGGAVAAALVQTPVPFPVSHRYPWKLICAIPYIPACDTSQDATAQPPADLPTRTPTCPVSAVPVTLPGAGPACSGPKTARSARSALASCGRATGPGYQHHTAAGACPVNAADSRPATTAYWL